MALNAAGQHDAWARMTAYKFHMPPILEIRET